MIAKRKTDNNGNTYYAIPCSCGKDEMVSYNTPWTLKEANISGRESAWYKYQGDLFSCPHCNKRGLFKITKIEV